jgi:hypothetical protein
MASSYEVAAQTWKPIDPAHLAMSAPVVEKDADAEALFWEVQLNDSGDDLIFSHYVRIKVFTERGKESQSKIDITYLGRNRIVDILGRTIKADGTIVDLKKDAIFDRTVAQLGGQKIKAKTFAMPSVEPGVIIEYRWKEIRPLQLADNVRLHFQRDIPVQLVKYSLKPLRRSIGYSSLGMATRVFNGEPSPLVKEKDGFYSTSMTNMPAFREEARMPPEDQVRTWMFVYYSSDKPLPPLEYWPRLGRDMSEVFKPRIKTNDDIKKAAIAAIGDAETPELKLQRLFEFCRTKIKNSQSNASGLTEADREKLKRNESPADTLKRGIGHGGDINCLFTALAVAAGFEARIAMLPDRGDTFFDPSFTHEYFLTNYTVAVKVGAEWRFFDPGTPYIPFGMLRWQEEGQQALICDPKSAGFVLTPISQPEKSVEKRTATLKLSEDGSIEGDVRIEYTGHLAVARKQANDDDSLEQQEQALRDSVKDRISTAELSDIKIENVTDPVKPFVYSFHVRVPGYASRTGKRLFLQPSFFEKGVGALFSAGERKHPIYFYYPWTEDDTVTIGLPSGFALDNADQPGPFRTANVCDYNVKIMVVGKNEALQYKRTLAVTGLLFPQTSYSGLKKVFDVLHERDNHTITLKESAAPAK